MDQAVIIQALEQACQGLNLSFQVIYQQETLYVCFDRQVGQVLDYDALTVTLQDAIAPLAPPEAQAAMLLCRVAGEAEPDWQTTVVLMGHRAEVPSETVSMPEQTEPDDGQVAFIEDSAIDAEASAEFEQPENSEENEILAEEEIPAEEDDKAADDISRFCFVRNKALVTAEVLPPERCVAELVQSFHDVSDVDKLMILPRLAQIFKTQNLGDTSQDSEAIANFCAQLTALSGSDLRKATIWLSRYCHNPELAMSKVGPVLNPVVVETKSPEPVAQKLRQHNASNIPGQGGVPTSYVSYDSPRPQEKVPNANLQLLLIPVLWTLLTLAIVWYNVQANNGSAAIAQLCKNATDSPDYCKLAVQLTGPATFETYAQQTKPSDENVAIEATQGCVVESMLISGGGLIGLQENSKRNDLPPENISNKEVLPGLFVVDVKQTNVKDGVSEIRTACVFGTIQNKETKKQMPIPLGMQAIPNQWPQEPLQSKSYNVKFAEAQSIHGILTLVGTNTLFTAIGLFLAVCLGLGIRVESLNALYSASLVFGIVDAMLSLIPIIGYFGIIRFTAIPVVALMVTSLLVKGLELDFSGGYKVIAMAGAIIIAVRILFGWLLLTTIISMV